MKTNIRLAAGVVATFCGLASFTTAFVPAAQAGFSWEPPAQITPAPLPPSIAPSAAQPSAMTPSTMTPPPQNMPQAMSSPMSSPMPAPTSRTPERAAPRMPSVTPSYAPLQTAPYTSGALTSLPNPQDYDQVEGFGSDLPLVMALRQIVPPQLSYSFGEGVDTGTRVSWSGGQSWDVVLQDALRPQGLVALIARNAVAIVDAGSVAPAMNTPQVPPSVNAQTSGNFMRSINVSGDGMTPMFEGSRTGMGRGGAPVVNVPPVTQSYPRREKTNPVSSLFKRLNPFDKDEQRAPAPVPPLMMQQSYVNTAPPLALGLDTLPPPLYDPAYASGYGGGAQPVPMMAGTQYMDEVLPTDMVSVPLERVGGHTRQQSVSPVPMASLAPARSLPSREPRVIPPFMSAPPPLLTPPGEIVGSVDAFSGPSVRAEPVIPVQPVSLMPPTFVPAAASSSMAIPSPAAPRTNARPNMPTSMPTNMAPNMPMNINAPNLAPNQVMDPLEIRFWQAGQGESLRTVMSRWASEGSVALLWQAGTDYTIPAPIQMHGTFPEVISTMLQSYGAQPQKPSGQLFPNLPNGPSVLVIQDGA